MSHPPVFGTRVHGCPYFVRPSAYALVRNAGGQFAVVRTPAGCYLPGGGIEADETAEHAARRKTIEEAGLLIRPRVRIGEAIEIVHSREENACFEKRCVFVEAGLVSQDSPHEPGHELIWLDPDDAASALSHGSHRWALQRCTQASCAEDSSTRSWDAVAEDWVAHADNNDYRIHYLMPRMLAMLGDVKDKRILDLGCGEGAYARELARRGADVIGIDGSECLLKVARQRAEAEGVLLQFMHLNASALNGIESASFDIVVASMSLMDVENYAASIREVCRVLRGRGELVMSITHPCFSAPVSEWIRDHDGALRMFGVDRYFERMAWESKITPAFRVPVLRRHRPLEDYMRAPIEYGLRLEEFHEPSVTPRELQLSNRFRKLARVPYFLFMRWRKP